MRTAAICPTCATYENALCIIYNGEYLTNADIDPLDNLEAIIIKLNAALAPLTGIIAPTASATYIGQQYVDTAAPAFYYAKSVGSGAADWVQFLNA